MNDFQNILLPEFLSPYIIGGPRFDTSILQSISGREVRYPNLSYAIQKYLIKDCYISHDELKEFNCFFRNCKGAAFSFCLKDYLDYQVRQQVLQVDINDQGVFELFKYYKFDTQIYQRRILKIIQGSLRVYSENQEIPAQINYNNGTITIPQEAYTQQDALIDFDFYVPVRFVKDHFSYKLTKDGSIGLEDIELTEVIL
jgi:uncharacterized protein (TIGR02217 family)